MNFFVTQSSPVLSDKAVQNPFHTLLRLDKKDFQLHRRFERQVIPLVAPD
jgi:hypothetical protein